ncbi:hypothetical protein CCZ01_04940 [Helicobacter monodelphidis]|nr:hypothetical protein CCZ01_04940 [Helicobacter sp. 15-1451]
MNLVIEPPYNPIIIFVKLMQSTSSTKDKKKYTASKGFYGIARYKNFFDNTKNFLVNANTSFALCISSNHLTTQNSKLY